MTSSNDTNTFDQVKGQWINPLYREGIGRRTGRELNINARRDSEGFENFSDYWTDSIESDISELVDKENDVSKMTETDKQKGVDLQNRKLSSPLKSMQSFASSGRSSESSSNTIRASTSSNRTTRTNSPSRNRESASGAHMETDTDEHKEPTDNGTMEVTSDEHIEQDSDEQREPSTEEHTELSTESSLSDETADKTIEQEKLMPKETTSNKTVDPVEAATGNVPAGEKTTTPVQQESLNEADVTGSIICSQVSQEPNSALRQFKTKKRLTFTSEDAEKEVMNKKETCRKSPRTKKKNTTKMSSDKPDEVMQLKQTKEQVQITDKSGVDAEDLNKTLTEGSDTPTERSGGSDTPTKRSGESDTPTEMSDGSDAPTQRSGGSDTPTKRSEGSDTPTQRSSDENQSTVEKQPRKSPRISGKSGANGADVNKSCLGNVRKSSIFLHESINSSHEASRFITLQKSHSQALPNGVVEDEYMDEDESGFEIVDEPVKMQKIESKKTAGKKATKQKSETHNNRHGKYTQKVGRKTRSRDVTHDAELSGKSESEEGESDKEEELIVRRRGKRGAQKMSVVGKSTSQQEDMQVTQEENARGTRNSKKNQRRSKVPERQKKQQEQEDHEDVEDEEVVKRPVRQSRRSNLKPTADDKEEDVVAEDKKVRNRRTRKTRTNAKAETDGEKESGDEEDEVHEEVGDEEVAKRSVRQTRRANLKPTETVDDTEESVVEKDNKKDGQRRTRATKKTKAEADDEIESGDEEDEVHEVVEVAKIPVRLSRRSNLKPPTDDTEEEGVVEGDIKKDGQRRTRNTRAKKQAKAETGNEKELGVEEDEGVVDEKVSKRRVRQTRKSKLKPTALADDTEEEGMVEENNKDGQRGTKNTRAKNKKQAKVETDDEKEAGEDGVIADQKQKDGVEKNKAKRKSRGQNKRQHTGESHQESDEQERDAYEENDIEIKKTRMRRGRKRRQNVGEASSQESEENEKKGEATKGKKRKPAKTTGKKERDEKEIISSDKMEENIEIHEDVTAASTDEPALESQQDSAQDIEEHPSDSHETTDGLAPKLESEQFNNIKRRTSTNKVRRSFELVQLAEEMESEKSSTSLQEDIGLNPNKSKVLSDSGDDVKKGRSKSKQSSDSEDGNKRACSKSKQSSSSEDESKTSRSRSKQSSGSEDNSKRSCSKSKGSSGSEAESKRSRSKSKGSSGTEDDSKGSRSRSKQSSGTEDDSKGSRSKSKQSSGSEDDSKRSRSKSKGSSGSEDDSKRSRSKSKSLSNSEDDTSKSEQSRQSMSVYDYADAGDAESDVSHSVVIQQLESKRLSWQKSPSELSPLNPPHFESESPQNNRTSKMGGANKQKTKADKQKSKTGKVSQRKRKADMSEVTVNEAEGDTSEVIAKKVQKSEVKGQKKRGRRKNRKEEMDHEDTAEVVVENVQKSEVIAKEKGQKKRGRRKSTPEDIEQAESELYEANSLSHDMLESEESSNLSGEGDDDDGSEDREEETEDRRASCVMKMGKQGTAMVTVHAHQQDSTLRPEQEGNHLMSRTPTVMYTDPIPTPKSILKRPNNRTVNRKNRRLTLKFFEQPKRKGYLVPPDETSGVRRTKRTRVNTLEYWRNERPLYERRKSGGFALVGVMSPPNKTPATKKTKARRREKATSLTPRNVSMHASPPPQAERIPSTAVNVINPETDKEVEIDAIVTSKMHHYVGPSGKVAEPEDPITVCKCLNQPAFSSGILKLRPFKEKSTQLVKKNTMVFYIVKGKLSVTIHNTTQILQTGDSFFVPQGNVYNIKNLRRDEAKLKFFQLKNSM